ncbi:MAG: hypothetical protein ACI8RY_002020 [Urechidicola sp.]|jgi:hypothetical protein
MGLSSGTLLQQTTFNFLKKIIEDRAFKLSYSEEHLYAGEGNERVGYLHIFPMICFSEIPLSSIHYHLNRYGNCLIGMKKKWIMANGFTPVHYYHQNSKIAISLLTNYHYIFEKVKGYDGLYEEHKDEVNLLHALEFQVAYAKNYSGVVNSKNYKDENYVFAEEKEWRFVPSHENYFTPISLPPEDFIADKAKYQEKIGEHKVSFDLSDISFIVGSSSDEKNELIALLGEMGNNSINVFTNTEIKQDFLGYQNPSIDDYRMRLEKEKLKSELDELKNRE